MSILELFAALWLVAIILELFTALMLVAALTHAEEEMLVDDIEIPPNWEAAIQARRGVMLVCVRSVA